MIKIKKYQIDDYISDATQSALDLKADLVDGKVPESQLPDFVNDVIEVANYAALPDPGSSGVIYITLDNNKLFRWNGSTYTEIASGVTNLSYTPGISNGVVNSDTGTDATIPLADATNAGLFSAAEKSKLEGLNAQNLQEVTDEGAITTNAITVDSVNYYSLIEPQDIGTENKITGSYAFLGGDGIVGLSNGTSESEIKNTNVTHGGVILEFPDKVGSSYTIATTDDYNLQSVLDNGNTATNQGIYLITNDIASDILTLDVYTTDGGYRAIKVDYDYLGDNASTAVQFTSNGIENPDEPGTGKTLQVNNTSTGNAIEAYSLAGKPIVTYGNGSVAIESNLGNDGEGLVINSGTSSTGNPITINKNGVDKFTINQQGEQSIVKIPGGTSSQFLMADGSVTTSSGGTTNLSYTASPTNGVVNSSTGTGATITLADATNAGLLKPAKFTVLENTSGTNTGDQDLSGLVVKNAAITGATKTKITYDSKGLVTAGTDATTADIADSTDKRYQTDNQKLYNDATSSIQTQLNAKVSGVTATSPITSSGGISPVISTSMSTNKLIGRSTTGTGVMEEITVGSGLTLTAGGVLNNTATPTGTGYYGAFQDTLTQTIGAINVGQPFLIRTTDESNQVSITANGSGELTRITPANTGTYNIQWSGQFQNPNNAIHDINVWFRKGLTSSTGPGTDIVGSNGKVALPARKSAIAGEEGHTIAGWNFLLTIAAGEYVEFYWMADNASITLQSYPGALPPPSTASLIVTVTQQAGIMAGTGITAINSLTGASQTLTTGTSGLDFNIVDSGVDHKFNLPTASATNRGALSTSDWTNFNTAYTNRITSLTTTGSSGFATLSSNVLNVPTYTLSGLGGISLTSLSSTATGITYTNTTGVFSLTSGYLIPTSASYNNTNWDTAYTDRNKWDGGATGLTAATGRISLGLGTFAVANYPTWVSNTPFVKMTAAGTFALDNSIYLTSAVTSVAALTLGTTGTDLSSTVATGTTTPVITLNVPTASASNRGALSSTDWTTFNNKQDKSLSAYTIMTNNTASTANATAQVYKEIAEQTLSGTGMTATGGTLPSGTQTHSYRWSQIGNLVTVRISLQFGTVGICSGISIPFSNMSDIPQTPQYSSIYNAAGDVITYGSGSMAGNKTFPTFTTANGTSAIRRNAAGTGFDFLVGRALASYTNAWIHIQYYI